MQQNGNGFTGWVIRAIFDYLTLLCVERNLNPKAACLKRREEEKADEYSASHNAAAASEAVLHNTVVCVLLSSIMAYITTIIRLTFINLW